MPQPTILFVPGFWVGPEPSAQVATLLRGAGFQTEITSLPSTGAVSPLSNVTMADDIVAIRTHVERIIGRGEDVLVVLHSASGFLGGAALKGLLKKERKHESGVIGAVLLTSAILAEGDEHPQTMPFAYEQDNGLHCKDPANLLYGDIPEPERIHWLAKLQPQPAPKDYFVTVPYAPWPHLPSVYVLCENDRLIPPAFQEQLAAAAGSKSIARVQSGHMPMLVVPEEVKQVIMEAAKDLSTA